MGLILVPLVEKAAEHLSAIDEAYSGRMNFALSHVLGATLQTALFNGPLAVIVGWGLHKEMSLSFEVFDLAVLILAIVTVGNFLRDQKSNYLEGGALCDCVHRHRRCGLLLSRSLRAGRSCRDHTRGNLAP